MKSEASSETDPQVIDLLDEVNGPATYWAARDQCLCCERPSKLGSYLCEQCKKLSDRIETRRAPDGAARRIDKRARLRAMRKQWNPDLGTFSCYFTGVPLNNVRGSRQYATWEHLSPGDESSVVLVSDLINRMKSDLTEDEFKTLVVALGESFRSGQFDLRAFPAERLR